MMMTSEKISHWKDMVMTCSKVLPGKLPGVSEGNYRNSHNR
jgi:hypothetical protein